MSDRFLGRWSRRKAEARRAEPPDEPPATRSGSCGLRTGPYHGFSDVTPKANSCRFVFPTLRQPAASSRRTASASRSGT